jgi:hypothetical protein
MLDIDSAALVGYVSQIWQVIQIYWIIPAGMLTLYFYGKFHFNTPEYSLDYGTRAESTTNAIARLITAPPMFTTSRAYYNRYARCYVAILEVAFIALVFFTSLAADLGNSAHLHISWPTSADPVQHRAAWALIALTVALSSFPGLKEIDNWLLAHLHKAALIPQEARSLAQRLYNAKFLPRRATIPSYLNMRDINRVADRQAAGALEQRVLQMEYLGGQLQTTTLNSKYSQFKTKLDRDLRQIESESRALRNDLAAYFQDQERLFLDDVKDIDQFLYRNVDKPDFAKLLERRGRLQSRCDTLYEVMCLLISLSVLATERNQEGVAQKLAGLGFGGVAPQLIPIEWDTVARVVGSVFLLMILINAAFAGFLHLIGPYNTPHFMPDRTSVLKFALLFTVVYSTVMIMALKLKRKWRNSGEPEWNRPENLIISIVSYASSLVLFNIPFGFYLRGFELSVAPFLYAANQAVLGYFIGKYIDEMQKRELPISFVVAGWQGGMQLVVSVIAMTMSPPLPGTQSVSFASWLYITAFSVLQSGISGFLIGVLFQYFHKRAVLQSRNRTQSHAPSVETEPDGQAYGEKIGTAARTGGYPQVA